MGRRLRATDPSKSSKHGPFPVTTVAGEVVKAALALADGDKHRLTYTDDGQAVVWNNRAQAARVVKSQAKGGPPSNR